MSSPQTIWQNIAGRAERLYPDKSRDWHTGYYAGCHNAGTAKADDLMPLSTVLPKDYRAGFSQGCLDIELRAQRRSGDST